MTEYAIMSCATGAAVLNSAGRNGNRSASERKKTPCEHLSQGAFFADKIPALLTESANAISL